VLGLALVVELLAHARADLLGDLAGVDHAVHAAVDREQPVKLLQVGLDRGLHVGVLQLGGEQLAVERARAMHLTERGGRGRLVLELGEPLLPTGAELGHHAPLHEGPAHRRRFALQLLQLLDIFRWKQVRDGRHQLGDLHDRAFQPAKHRGQLRGVLAAIERETEQAARGEPGRNRPHIGTDAGIARRAGGEAVGFTIGHTDSLGTGLRRNNARHGHAWPECATPADGQYFSTNSSTARDISWSGRRRTRSMSAFSAS
jgi:hypothetical protein